MPSRPGRRFPRTGEVVARTACWKSGLPRGRARPTSTRWPAGPKLPAVDYELIRGTASNGSLGQQPVSRANAAGVSRRDADRPSGERSRRAHNSRFLQPAIHAGARPCRSIPSSDASPLNLHTHGLHVSPREMPTSDAPHAGRDREHLHLRHSHQHPQGATGITAISTG